MGEYAQFAVSLSSETSLQGPRERLQGELPTVRLAETRWKKHTEKKADMLKIENTSKEQEN